MQGSMDWVPGEADQSGQAEQHLHGRHNGRMQERTLCDRPDHHGRFVFPAVGRATPCPLTGWRGRALGDGQFAGRPAENEQHGEDPANPTQGSTSEPDEIRQIPRQRLSQIQDLQPAHLATVNCALIAVTSVAATRYKMWPPAGEHASGCFSATAASWNRGVHATHSATAACAPRFPTVRVNEKQPKGVVRDRRGCRDGPTGTEI